MSKTKSDRKRRQGIYLLPNLLTTAALFAGFYAIVAANQMRFEAAAIAIFVAMVLDGLDGRVARMTNTQTDFGAQYDSLADIVSFGVAPALIMYEWSLYAMRDFGWHWSKLGWLAAFIYVAAAALRLARFNVQSTNTNSDKRFFQGLASPAAAAIMVGFVWVSTDLGYVGSQLAIPALLMTTICGMLMVSRFAYYSFKDLDSLKRVSFTAMLMVVLIFVFISFDPAKVLFTFFFIYMLSGPCTSFLRKMRKRANTKKTHQSTTEPL